MEQRPDFSPTIGAAEFRRWYWTLAELKMQARQVGVSPGGSKTAVTERIASALDGESPAPKPLTPRMPRQAPMAEPFTTASVIPRGQRSTTALREFFTGVIGDAFRFDGHMRAFLRDSDGATLGDAIDHWHATRGTELPTQSKSLEFNRFTKQWHQAHPDGSAAEARAAWKRYRSLPVDKRPLIADA